MKLRFHDEFMQPWFVRRLYIKLSSHPPSPQSAASTLRRIRYITNAARSWTGNRVHDRVVNCCGRFVSGAETISGKMRRVPHQRIGVYAPRLSFEPVELNVTIFSANAECTRAIDIPFCTPAKLDARSPRT